MNKNKQNYYNQVIQDKLGLEYIKQVEYIKQEQCRYCKNKQCRLDIKDKICINYKE